MAAEQAQSPSASPNGHSIWKGRLEDQRPEVRLRTLDSIRRSGPEALAAHAWEIAALLREECPKIRRAALCNLSGLEAARLAPHAAAIAARLEDETPLMRRRVLRTLSKVDAEALLPHVPAVAACLKDPDLDVVSAALYMLGGLGPAQLGPYAARVASTLEQSDWLVRRPALWTLGQLDPETLAPLVPAVASCLRDARPEVCRAALQVLGGVGSAHLGLSKDPSAKKGPDTRRKSVLVALEKLEAKANTESLVLHAPAVASFLGDADPKIRQAALWVLSELMPADLGTFASVVAKRLKGLADVDADALTHHAPAIASFLNDEDAEVREAALHALGALEPKPLATYAAEVAARLEDECLLVHCLALRTLRRLEPEALEPHAPLVAECLDDEPEERAVALEVLGGLRPATLGTYATAVAERLQDPSPQVIEAALLTLGKLEAETLALHAAALARFLQDGRSRLREAALQALGGLQAAQLAQHAEALSASLDHDSPAVRKAALTALGKLEVDALDEHLDAVTSRLRDADVAVRTAALSVLAGLPPEQLERHVVSVSASLEDRDRSVRRSALRALGRLGAEALTQHAAAVAVKLNDKDQEVCAIAKELLGRMDPAKIAEVLGREMRADPKVGVPVLHALETDGFPVATLPRLIHLKFQYGRTLLHLAAEQGLPELCKELIITGALIAAKDARGATPAHLAKLAHHAELESLLAGMMRVTATRGGTGNAFRVAQDDTRFVVQIEWYTLPLSGIAGELLGCVHSLLAVTVEDPSGASRHTYVIEKAAGSPSGLADGDADPFENGVYVSHWTDVQPQIEKAPIHRLLAEDVSCKDFLVRSLREVVVEMGPYNVASCSCHHAAQAAFNFCARPGAHVAHIPNRRLTFAARALSAIGVNVAESESALVPTSGAARSECVVGSACVNNRPDQFPIIDTSEGHRDPWLADAACLAEWIYIPGSEGGICLVNATEETLVFYAEEARETLHVLPEHTGHLMLKGVEGTVHVRINSIGPFGFATRRTRLARVELQVNSNYHVNKAEGGVRCTETRLLPKHLSVECLELSTDEKGSVQWALVASSTAIFVVFRGTDNVVDILVDMGLLTNDDAPHGVRVHSGMWAVLTQRRHHLINDILHSARDLFKERPGLKDLVLCGHSLGGSYAILCALGLLHRGIAVSAVRTFGACQAVVPDWDSKIWCQLNAVTAMFVNSFDFVARMPSCVDWVSEVLPRSGTLGRSFGPLRLRVNLQEQFTGIMRGAEKVLCDYDQVGTLAFITQGSRSIRWVPISRDGSHRRHLQWQPECPGAFIFEHHSSIAYRAIVCGLRAQLP